MCFYGLETGPAGGLVKQTNALGGINTYVDTTDGSTGGLIRTNIYPDGGTRIESYYLDGSLKKVLGTAANPTLYFYGLEGVDTTGDSDDNYRPYTIEVNRCTRSRLQNHLRNQRQPRRLSLSKILVQQQRPALETARPRWSNHAIHLQLQR